MIIWFLLKNSELQQIRNQQDDELERLNTKIKDAGLDVAPDFQIEEQYLKDFQRPVTCFELLALTSLAFIVACFMSYGFNMITTIFEENFFDTDN